VGGFHLGSNALEFGDDRGDAAFVLGDIDRGRLVSVIVAVRLLLRPEAEDL
jgi:hypothetical protein